MTARFVSSASIVVFIGAATSPARVQDKPAPAPALSEAAYKLAGGPYAVETVEEIVLRDKTRSKDLPVYISYPKAGGPFPVIVFSHGTGGSGRNVATLTKFWAGHGYVCLNPTHADSIALRKENAAGGVTGIVGRATRDASGGVERAKDASFLLDSLDELEVKVPGLKNKMDRRRIGVGGHSLGAYTAQLIGGATVDVPGKTGPQSFADNRAKAVLLLSGQGSGQQGLTRRSWEAFTRPLMSVTGSLDRGAQGQSPGWRREPFQYSPPGDKYHLYIEGAHHGSFTGRFAEGGRTRGGGVGQPGNQTAIFGYVKSATVAFWDAYLKGDAKAKAYLQSGALADDRQQTAKLSRK